MYLLFTLCGVSKKWDDDDGVWILMANLFVLARASYAGLSLQSDMIGHRLAYVYVTFPVYQLVSREGHAW